MAEETNPDALRVLIVEDNPFDVVMAESILRNAGFPVMIQHATELSDGVARAARCADLVLLDLTLPDAASGDALAAIERFGTPVVVLTGDDSPRRAYQAGQAGAIAALSKFAAHTQLLPAVMFVAGACAKAGTIPGALADLIDRSHH